MPIIGTKELFCKGWFHGSNQYFGLMSFCPGLFCGLTEIMTVNTNTAPNINEALNK